MRNVEGMFSRQEAAEVLALAQDQGDYSLGSVVPRAMTTIIVLWSWLDSLTPGAES